MLVLVLLLVLVLVLVLVLLVLVLVLVLRTFTRNFSNIDFFLKILPLKDDELAMPEM